MAIKKSELYSSLWPSCDELRGGMDASQYKDYVLVIQRYFADAQKMIGALNADLETLQSPADQTGMMQNLLTGRVRLI